MTGRIAKLGLLVVGTLVVGVLATEAAYRVLARFVCISAPPRLYEHRDWGWTHRPNAATWIWGCLGREFEYRTWVEINSHGLRDREIDYDRPASRERVLVLGDSMAAALQVPLDETFTKVVERRLREAGRDVDVVNAGHSGFGTDNELLFYEQEGRRYRPDLVVLVFNFQNDVVENSQSLSVRNAESVGRPCRASSGSRSRPTAVSLLCRRRRISSTTVGTAASRRSCICSVRSTAFAAGT